ncbi:hypothetical protein MLD38_003678 [Melastoma candidum]|uniref:Uncharacterized protein n=1 Tax=Melastoma candidum TaxID=119954 RepID=A0ACB9S4Q5_9MYRT|nr:hypothetical protein MLD38_003678 [Melastoma candidum]
MAFSTTTTSSSSSVFPVYLHLDDPPTIAHNIWPPPPHPHQSNHQLSDGSFEDAPGTQLPPLLPPHGRGSGGSRSIRPHSTAERARLAKIPQPEAGLNCPRCDSTNTKFCYFNNYSLSQPRHFCKSCRRYWTRGGALRSVPVGGGCRRNKKAKGGRGRPKSPVTSERAVASASSLPSTSATATVNSDILGHLATQLTQMPLFHPVHNINDFAPAEVGAGIGLGFHVGLGDHSQWRIHEMPQPSSFFPNMLEGQGIGQLLPNNKPLYSSPNAMADLMTTVKSEGLNHIQDLNLSSGNFMTGNEQYTTWLGNTNWSDLPGSFSSGNIS